MLKRHRIQFPKPESSNLNQDESYFYLEGSGGQREIRFHDYDEITRYPACKNRYFMIA